MGFFISFEGIEGSGKTTQMEMLKEHLEWKGKDIVGIREPGGTELGERIRAMLLQGERSMEEPIDSWAELFLYEASRAQLISMVIKPALEAGKIVICDRFMDSTVSYQGYGRGLNLEAVEAINRLGSRELKPDITFLVDCPVEVGLKRAWSRGENKNNRFEKEALEFHARVREGYLKIAKTEPARIKVIDGVRPVNDVHKEVCDIIEKVMPAV